MPSDAARALWNALCKWPDADLRRTGRKPRYKASDILREKLEEQLGLHDVTVWANKGYWSHVQQDCYRWEFTGFMHCGDKDCKKWRCLAVTGGSYDTMTLAAQASRKLEWLSDRFDGEVCAVLHKRAERKED